MELKVFKVSAAYLQLFIYFLLLNSNQRESLI